MSGHVTNAYELGRRAMACKYFYWMPGMLLSNGRRVGVWTGGICGSSESEPPYGGVVSPDLSDPATLGCLLALVREAYSDPLIFTVYDSGYWFVENQHGLMAQKNTEAEALVRVLEVAP